MNSFNETDKVANINESDSYNSDSDSGRSMKSKNKDFSDQIISEEDLKLIYEHSLLAKKMSPLVKVVKKINKTRNIDKKNCEMVLRKFTYEKVLKNKKSLKKILHIIGLSTKDFFKMMIYNKKQLKQKLNELKKWNPLIIKYLNWIFKDSKIYNEKINISNKLERTYEKCYFSKNNLDFIKGNYIFYIRLKN